MTIIDDLNEEKKSIPTASIIHKSDLTKKNLLRNQPIEDKLHVIAVVSNPCLFQKRYKLMNEFIQRITDDESNVILYIVELAYGDQTFAMTDASNKNHLQLRTEIPLWHKENMINLGVKHLLPSDWKAFAWIDADLEFESPSWALDTLKLLNGSADIIQLFSHCLDLDQNNSIMSVFSSFCYQYSKQAAYSGVRGQNYWHPGYAWACTREAYDQMGGLFEYGILGSADYNMASCLIGYGHQCFIGSNNDIFKQKIIDFQRKVKDFKIGYVPGVIRHYFHGSKVNRKYSDRWKILAKYDYNPDRHITFGSNGVIIPTSEFSKEFIADIYNYFLERNEDEFL
jgi:hypothetical protein